MDSVYVYVYVRIYMYVYVCTLYNRIVCDSLVTDNSPVTKYFLKAELCLYKWVPNSHFWLQILYLSTQRPYLLCHLFLQTII